MNLQLANSPSELRKLVPSLCSLDNRAGHPMKRLRMPRSAELCLAIALAGSCELVLAWTQSPPLNPDLIASKWPASWIASPFAPAKAPGVFYFRKEIVLAVVPQHYWVHVSADNRFVLHVNGLYLAEGPARGDLLHWRFETVDLAPLLRAGNNVIAALVWNFGESAPTAQMSNRTGFLMQGDTKVEAAVNTGLEWRVREEMGRAAPSNNTALAYSATGPEETIDGRVLDWSWDQPGDGDLGWETPDSLALPRRAEALDAQCRVVSRTGSACRRWSIASPMPAILCVSRDCQGCPRFLVNRWRFRRTLT